MPVDTATVTHDAAALYRFVDTVAKFAEESSSSVYVKASDEFFEYIRELGKKTKQYLCDFPKNLPTNDVLRSMYRQKLKVLRDAWRELHAFLKPATDADTLNTPFSLLGALYHKFHGIAGFENVEFTVFHLDEVNYLQVMASWFRQLTQKLAYQIPGAPSFPTHLGLIGIPYSQSSAIFLNALIPHEMGHFVYQQLGKSNALLPDIHASLSAELGGTLISPNDRRWCVDKLSSWAEEIFCDLFAVWMVGPAYVFAYTEIFDLANIPAVALLSSAPKRHLEFHAHHPADACRLSEHAKSLKELGWLPLIASFKTHYIDVLSHVASIAQTDYNFTSDRPALEKLTVAAFFRLLHSVEDANRSVVQALQAGASDYARYAKSVEDYLHSGVVPSTVLKPIQVNPAQPEFEHPDPISVLNVAYKIHLESIDMLLSQVGKLDSVDARSEWTTRLEHWTSKAFEDYALVAPSP
jgi:hypothetical protein